MSRKDLHDYLRLVVMIGVVVLVGAAPFAFGAVHPFFYSMAQVVAFLLLGVGTVGVLLRGQPRSQPKILALCMAGLSFGLLCAFQLLPQPVGLLKLISPATVETVRRSTPWRSGAGWMPLSLRPFSTQLGLLQFLACFSVFLLVVTFFRRNGARKKLAWGLCGIGVLLALVGLYDHWTPSDKIYGFWESVHGGAHFGPFVNRNHFAGYIALIIPIAAALIFVNGFGDGQGRRDRHRRRRSHGPDWSQVLAASALLIMLAALLTSLSRGGFIAAAVSACVMSALAWWKAESRKAGRVCAAVFTAGFLLGAYYAGPAFLGRLGDLYRDLQNPLETGRAVVAERSLALFGKYPVFGVGLGTFQSVFPSVQTPELGKGLWAYGHNDWVQLVAETGAVGILACLCFGGILVWLAWGRLTQRRPTSAWWLTAGASASLVGLLVHGLVEFNLHIPSNSFLATAVVGLVCVSALSARRPRRRPPLVRMRPVCSWLAVACLAVVLGTCSFTALSHVASSHALHRESSDTEDKVRLIYAARLTPLDPRPAYELSRRLEQEGRAAADEGRARRLYVAARDCARLAARLAPTNPQYQHNLGWLRTWSGGSPGEADLAAAEEHLKRAIELDPAFANWSLSLAEFYLQTGRFSDAHSYFRRALSLDPALTDRVMARLAEYGAGGPTLQKALPDEWRPQMALLDWLLKNEQKAQAREVCQRMVENFPNEEPARKSSLAVKMARAGAPDRARELLQGWMEREGQRVEYLRALAGVARTAGDSERQLRILRELASIRPDSVQDCAALARYLRSEGEYEEALKFFRRAFESAPRNSSLCDAVIGCLKRLGRDREALQVARDFLLRRPDEASAHYRVGEILYGQDRLVEAVREYEKATELAPDNSTYKKALNRTLALLAELRRLKQQEGENGTPELDAG